jgi:enoyl-CoA hydratase/carnithine racemase
MFESIAEAASKLRTDPDCRVVILSGEGRAFCTGLDAKSVAFEGKALKRLLDRPSGYGGENGLGNLAQDVAYLWRYVNEFKVLCPVCLLTVFLFIQFSNMTFCY